MKIVLVDEMTPEAFSGFMDTAPLPAITHTVLNDLAKHMNMDMEAVATFLYDEANRCQKPIAINIPCGAGSITQMMGPKGWTRERLMGWMATKKDALEQAFGDIAAMKEVE